MKSLFNIQNKKSPLQCNIFLDQDNDGVALSRFEEVKYPRIQKLREIQEGFFWRPMEIDLTKDQRDFKNLGQAGQHIFTSNLLFQTLLDSEQSRAPERLFSMLTALPEVEHFCNIWGFFESIHSFSYSYIIRNIYPNPTEVFDNVVEIPEIINRAKDINRYYDQLYNYTLQVFANGYVDGRTRDEHLKLIWLAMMAANVLEGVRFYVSFACSWAFAEQKLMVGNADIIKLICRDENVHLGFTQYMLKTLPTDDPIFVKIAEETEEECIKMFEEAASQEKDWAKYLFKYGSILGLNEPIMCSYVDWIAKKRAEKIGLKLSITAPTSNPLPWTESWINGRDVQTANQEQENTQYVIGGLDKTTGREKVLAGLGKYSF